MLDVNVMEPGVRPVRSLVDETDSPMKVGKTRGSPFCGTPLGLQFEAVLQVPLPTSQFLTVCAAAVSGRKTKSEKTATRTRMGIVGSLQGHRLGEIDFC